MAQCNGKQDKDSGARIRDDNVMKDDDIIQRVEAFDFDAGAVAAERRNRSFTLIHAATGARLRPLGRDDLYEIRW